MDTKNSIKPEMKVAVEYLKIPLKEFVAGKILELDLYLDVRPGYYILIANQGTLLSASLLQKYTFLGRKWFYVNRNDYISYIGLSLLFPAGTASLREEAEQQIEIARTYIKEIMGQFITWGFAIEEIEGIGNSMMNIVRLLSDNAYTLKLLQGMDSIAHLLSHYFKVSFWSCLIAKKNGYRGEKTFFKLIVSALFHDIGKKDEILKDLPPFSRLINIASYLTQHLGTVPAERVNLHQGMEHLLQREKDFDPQHLNLLREMILALPRLMI